MSPGPKVENAATVCFGAAAVVTRAPPVDGPRFCTRHSLPGPGAIATLTRRSPSEPA